MKLQTRLNTSFLVIAVVPILLLGSIFYFHASRVISDSVQRELNGIASLKKEEALRIVEQNYERVEGVVSQIHLRLNLKDFNKAPSFRSMENISRIITNTRDGIKDFEEIYIFDKNGRFVASTSSQKDYPAIINETVLNKEKQEKHITVEHDSNGISSVYLSAPLKLNNEFLGLAVVAESADSIKKISSYSYFGKTEDILLAQRNLNGDAVFIAPRRFENLHAAESVVSKDRVDAPIMLALEKQEKILLKGVDYRGEDVISVTRYIEPVGWGLVVKIDEAEAFEPLIAIRNNIIIFGVIIIVFVFIRFFYITKSIVNPINHLCSIARRIASGDFDQKMTLILKKADSEINDLWQSFMTMTRSLLRADADLKRQNEALEDMIEKDPLTGVLNRRGLEVVLEKIIAEEKRTGESSHALLLDLDDFKSINDHYGHGVGDVALMTLTKNVIKKTRITDYVSRVGGDEFIVILKNTKEAEARKIAEKILIAISQDDIFIEDQKAANITVSIGLVKLHENATTIDELLQCLHLSLQKSKREGKNRVSTFRDVDEEGVEIGRESEGVSLRQILRQGNHIYSVKQPIMDFQEGRIMGYEMLSRISVSEFELPEDFLNLAKSQNFLTLMDRLCLKTCFAASNQLPADKQIHINIFPSTLIGYPKGQMIKEFPRSSKKGSLCFELSEQQIIGDPSYLLDSVQILKENNILIGIDDLGFGHSSLESIILLDPDVVKIDKSCVIGVAEDGAKRKRLKSLTKMLNAFNFMVIAEGVENVDDFKVLRDMGIRYGQGFVFGHPE